MDHNKFDCTNAPYYNALYSLGGGSQKIHYDDSRYEYGRATHWIYENWMKEGYLYGINYEGDLYFVYLGKYEMFEDAPEYLGGDVGTYYLSDSVIYVGDIQGRIYYADPGSGDIIWTIDVSRLHIYFNATNSTNSFYGYYILYGDRSGYFYLLFNNTLYHLYRDIKILDKYKYPFRGFPVAASPWEGGLIIKFIWWDRAGNDTSREASIVYYVKDGKIIWQLNFTHTSLQIFKNYVYYLNGSKIDVYKNGTLMWRVYTYGTVVDLKDMGDNFYVVTYSGTKNLLLLYDKNFNFIKKVVLFDMKSIGVKDYNIANQKVNIYKNSSGYTVFLYTYDGAKGFTNSYVPMRIIYLDKNLNVTWRDYADVEAVTDAYPLPQRDEFIIVQDRCYLEFVTVRTVTEVNYFARMDIKLPVFIFSLMLPAYFYSLSREIAIRRRKYP